MMIIVKVYYILCFKIYCNNFFCILYNNLGNVVFKSHSGYLGFSNIKKRSIEALSSILQQLLLAIQNLKFNSIFIKYEGLKHRFLAHISKLIFSWSIKYKFSIAGINYINKIPHGGCRIKK